MHDILSDGLFLDLRGEVLHEFEIDVRLEKGHADLAKRRIDVVLRESPLPGKSGENIAQPICQILKCHR